MADVDAWRDGWTVQDALNHLSSDCNELTRCLQIGDEDLAGLVAAELAKLRAPVKLRRQRSSYANVSANAESPTQQQATSSATGGNAVAAAAAVLKAAGRSTLESSGTGTSNDRQMWKHGVGDRVEYFSQSAGGWIPGVVKGIDTQRGTYALDIQPVALPVKVRTPAEQSSNDRSVGVRQHGIVASNEINAQHESTGYQAASSSTAPVSSASRHAIGEIVEYYSNTNGKWVQAVVQGYTESTGTYKLDIQPMALPGKVRKVPSPVSMGSKVLAAAETNNRESLKETGSYLQSDISSSKQAVQKQVTEINEIDDIEVRKEEWQKLLQKWNPDNNPDRLQVCVPVYEALNRMWNFSQVGSGKAPPAVASGSKVTNPFSQKSPENTSASSQVSSTNPFRIAANDAKSSAVSDARPEHVHKEQVAARRNNDELLSKMECEDSAKDEEDPWRPSIDCSDGSDWISKQVDQGFQREARRSPELQKEGGGSMVRRSSCRICERQCELDTLLGPPCGHLYCTGCLKAYVVRHDFVRQVVKCPSSACKTELDPVQIRHIIGSDDYDKQRSRIDMEAVQMLQKEMEYEKALEAANVARKHAFQCPLCLEQVARENSIELDCDHKFCAECFRNYLSSLISEAQVASDELTCPIPKCGREITVAQIQGATADTPLWSKFLQFRMNIWVPNAGDGYIVECPTPDCEKFLVDRRLEVVKCRSCKKEFCPKCRKDAHKGSSCQAYERSEKERLSSIADQHFEELMISEGWKPCPVCGAPSERDSGCNFMQCRSGDCRKRTYWCYICGLQMKKEDHYTHFQKGPYEDQCKTPLCDRKVVARRKGALRESDSEGYAWGWLSYAAGAAGF